MIMHLLYLFLFYLAVLLEECKFESFCEWKSSAKEGKGSWKLRKPGKLSTE